MGRRVKAIEVGTRFNRLEVIGPAGVVGRNAASLCRCDCGVEKVILNFNLGATESCGCLARENASARVKKKHPGLKHGGSKTITYSSWQCMVARCLNKDSWNYPRYGARGVTVSPRWSDSDTGFRDFLKDMGERPSSAHSIDRKDGSKGYEPGNCRWVTRTQQNRNILFKKNKNGYRGVYEAKHLDKRPWKAEIRGDRNKRFHLGCYMTKERAALAYNVASERLHGVYGVRNALPPMTKKETNFVFRKVNKILDERIKEI